jgi:hypothetical protein
MELNHTRQVHYKGSRGAKLLLLLFSSWMCVTAAGCGEPKFSGSAPPSSVLQAPLSDADKQQAEQIVQQFVADAQQGDFSGMEPMMSATLLKTQPATAAVWGPSGKYRAFAGSRDWAFDLVEARNNGAKIIVHAHFTGSDAGNYRTNFVLLKRAPNWAIDAVLVPSKAVHPVSGAATTQKR